MKEKLRAAAALLLPVPAAILLGALLLVCVRAIPSDMLRQRAAESAALNYSELRPELLPQVEISQLDNYTDSLMLNLCLTESGSPVRDALSSPFTSYGGDDAAEDFRLLAAGAEGGTQIPYTRYWHGWQLFLRPLLLFANLSTIRYLLMALELALTVLLVGKLCGGRPERGIPFLAFWLSLYPPGLFFSLQYGSVYCVTLLGCLGVLYGKEEKRPLLFELLGIAVAYLDFLTYPLVALGVPLALVLTKTAGTERHIGRRAEKAFFLCVCWGFGYALMWAGKWVLAGLLTGVDAVGDSLSTAAFRMSGQTQDEAITALSAIGRNLSFFAYKGLLLSLLLLAAALLFLLLRRGSRPVLAADVLGLLACAAMPFVWYALLANHSQIHAFFTFRELGVTVFALFSLLLLPLRAPPDAGE